MKAWKAHERLPSCSLRELFSRFLDITTPPSPNLLQHFASIATDEEDQRRLTLLATVSNKRLSTPVNENNHQVNIRFSNIVLNSLD